jgi:mannan endo-1,6-alpha-mannosidase
MGLRFRPAALVGSLFASHLVTAADFSLNGREEIIASAKTLAEDLVSSHYPDVDEPGTIPGLLSDETYYFWQAGAFMGHMINYWHLTDDEQFNGLVARGMRHQVGQDNDFMPANQTRSLMNDDQCTWGSAAMLAAENGLPGNEDDEWLQYAENVFDDMWSRFESNDEETCGGGLRWALFNFNAGWDYKNTGSNACFFDLAARLARYTGNETYAEAATAAWDWMVDVELIDTSDWTVLQGTTVQENCTDASGIAESETVAYLAHGAAFMFNRVSSLPPVLSSFKINSPVLT